MVGSPRLEKKDEWPPPLLPKNTNYFDDNCGGFPKIEIRKEVHQFLLLLFYKGTQSPLVFDLFFFFLCMTHEHETWFWKKKKKEEDGAKGLLFFFFLPSFFSAVAISPIFPSPGSKYTKVL